MEKQSKKSLDEIFEVIAPASKELEVQLISTFDCKNTLVNRVAQYIISSGGKRLRPALVFLFAGMVGSIEQKHYELAKAVELIHSATLVHDDIIDEADLRRNNVSAHKKWDTKTAVLAGDFLLAKALKSLTNIKSTDVLEVFSTTMEEICEGEVEQSLNSDFISFDDYIQRAKRKTAMLFAAATKNSVDINKQSAYEYGINLGIAFQITDDLLVFQDNYEDKSKEVDFKNNLLTTPVLFAIEKGVKLDFEGDFSEFKENIIDSGAIEKSQNLALNYANRAIENLNDFQDNQYKESLKDLVSYIINREL